MQYINKVSLYFKSSSLKLNILSNYIGQFYIMGLSIVMVPAYLHYLGNETFGLVGFFTLLTNWMQFLNLGMTGTLARQSASFRSKSISPIVYRIFVKTFFIIFLYIGLFISASVALFSDYMATNWLSSTYLPIRQVRYSIILMGIALALKFQAGIQRSVLVGLEKQFWLNAINITMATVRYLGAIVVFLLIGSTPVVFFSWIVISLSIEYFAIAFWVSALLPNVDKKIAFSFKSIKPSIGFSLSIAIASAIWIFVTQTDKLILSKILSLKEFGFFSIAILAANGINLFSGPISQAVQPRLTYYFVRGDELSFISLYLKTTETLSSIVLPVSFVIFFFSNQVLYAWTGDIELANAVSPVLSFYAMGNGMLGLVALTYNIQFAHGNLKLHLYGNIVFAVFLIPLIIIITNIFGMIGAALVWFFCCFCFLFIWSFIVHKTFAPGIHKDWLIHRIIIPGIFGAIPSVCFFCFNISFNIRPLIFLFIGFLFFVSIAFSFGSCKLSNFIKTKRHLF